MRYRRRIIWNPERDQLARDAAKGTITYGAAAKRIGCTPKSVRDRAVTLGVQVVNRRRGHSRAWSEDDERLLRAHSRNPDEMPLAELLTRLRCSRLPIYSRARQLGLTVHLSRHGVVSKGTSEPTEERGYGVEPPITVGVADRLLERLVEMHGDRTYGTSDARTA